MARLRIATDSMAASTPSSSTPPQADTACSIAATLSVIGDRWTVLILREAFRGVHRFSQFVENLGIARNLLTNRLNQLVDHGILERVMYCERPRRHEYHLTAKGWALSPALVSLMHWGDEYYAPGGPPTVLVCRSCDQPVAVEVRCPQCDCSLRPSQIRSA